MNPRGKAQDAVNPGGEPGAVGLQFVEGSGGDLTLQGALVEFNLANLCVWSAPADAAKRPCYGFWQIWSAPLLVRPTLFRQNRNAPILQSFFRMPDYFRG
jgi:hypothetical protein